MTKTFCDICGKPSEAAKPIQAIIYFGQEFEDEEYNKRRKGIRAFLKFNTTDFPPGFGTDADVCKECVLKLIAALKTEAESMK